MYEVEMKFPLATNSVDIEQLKAQLDELQAARATPIDQQDLYFAHPVRDFAETDEALRVRRAGDRNRVTYKGPIVDPIAKTREEIEVRFADGSDKADQVEQLLQKLSFRPVRIVRKTRTPYQLDWEDREVELVLDDVVGLGMFLEIETMADESDREVARDSILRLSQRLGLEKFERKSYLCLLIEKETTDRRP
jgi:adenylate cyclase, class 2